MFRWFETRIDAFPETAPERPPTTLLAFYWYFVKPVWPVFLVLLVVGCIGSLIEVALFAFVGSLVDLMRTAEAPETFFADHGSTLLWMGFVAMILRPAVSTAHDLIKNQMISGPFTTRIRWMTHRYVLRQSLGFFQNDFAGRVANKVMQTGPALRESVVQVVDAVWYVAVYWTGAIVLFWQADWRLTLPLLAWLVAYGFAIVHFVPRIKQASTAASEARSMLMGRIVDSYTNILTVKLFAHADREDGYARDGLREQMGKWQASLRLLTSLELVLYTMNGLLLVSVTGLALWLWTGGLLTIGAIALATGLVIRIVNMSGWVLFTVAGIFENIGIVQEGVETISRANSVVDAAGAVPLRVHRGELRFEAIRFNYGVTASQQDEPGTLLRPRIIKDLSLTVRPGEKVGLVGRSGAGKSTLVNLLLRFYDLESGRILIDGQDISRVTQESLRAQIGMVTQDTSLLHRSVRDNILYGRPDAGLERAVAAARRAEAHGFIVGSADMKGRRGYDAHVGERGVKLSGGQRQRIAIARVLLKDAPILILDEATSALDSEAEAAIQEQLFNLMQGKTVIAIAHRLSTIAAMDRLVVMDEGAIAEEGSHAELIQRGGLYAELWARQSGGFLAKEAAE
ncbi:MAG: ABC transporter ATP-binding protein [Hyphomicrobiaceae bacterium]|nr:ABC transporter ATP-binding protein [Hyphomicrobiaceae bacterium]